MPYKDRTKKNRYQREWCAKRRAEVLEDCHCQRCGATENLELHHRNPAEKDSSNFWSRSWEYIWAEVAKCDVLCRDCHLMVHYRIAEEVSADLSMMLATAPY